MPVSAIEQIILGSNLRGNIDFAAYVALAHTHIAGVGETDAGLCLAHLNVVKPHIGHRLLGGALQDKGCFRHLAAFQSIDNEIFNHREMIVVKPFARIFACDIKKVLNLIKHAIPHIKILYETAAVRIGLDVDAALAVSGVVAILHKHIAHSARHLAAEHHRMKPFEMTIAYYDILTWKSHSPAVVVTTALYRHVVIAVVEIHILYEDIARAFRIDAVIVHEFGIVTQRTAYHILALQEMHAPERGIDDIDPFKSDILTVDVRIEEMGRRLVKSVIDKVKCPTMDVAFTTIATYPKF